MTSDNGARDGAQESMEEVSISETRTSISSLVDRVLAGTERIAITRHGKIAAFMVSPEDFSLLEEMDDRDDAEDAAWLAQRSATDLSGSKGPAVSLLCRTYYPGADLERINFRPTSVCWLLTEGNLVYGRTEFSPSPERISLVGFTLHVPGLRVDMTPEEAAALCLLAAEQVGGRH